MSMSPTREAPVGHQDDIHSTGRGAVQADTFAALKDSAKAHKGGWNIHLLLQQAQDKALLAEGKTASACRGCAGLNRISNCHLLC